MDTSLVPISSCDTEFLTLYVKQLRLLVICCYHPIWNNVSKHEEAISTITNIIDSVLSSPLYPPDCHIVLCGDFNDLHKFSGRISNLTSLSCHVFVPTRLQNCLDLIFSTYVTTVQATVLPPLGRSDHQVVLWKPDSVCIRPSYHRTTIRKFTKSGTAWLVEKIVSTDWLALSKSESNLDEAASLLLSSLRCLFDLAFPVRSIRVRNSDPAWLTPQLRFLMKERDVAWRNGNNDKFRRLRDEVSRGIRCSKGRLVKSVSSPSNTRAFWHSVKKTSRCALKVAPAPHLAQDFNDFFSTIYNSSDINHGVLGSNSDLGTLPNSNLEVSVHEVSMLLETLRKRSPGPDGLPAWLLKTFSVFLSPALTFIINRSLKECHVPLCFKEAIITPVPKTPSARHPSDHRPISLLPLMSKVLEKLVSKYWILPFVNDIDKSQFAFLPRVGSGTTL